MKKWACCTDGFEFLVIIAPDESIARRTAKDFLGSNTRISVYPVIDIIRSKSGWEKIWIKDGLGNYI